MKATRRRYAMGRLVRCRAARRATLQSERDLVFRRLGLIVLAIDRFELLLQQLRSAGDGAARDAAAGCSQAPDAPTPEPDARTRGSLRDAGSGATARAGNPPTLKGKPCLSTPF